MSNIFYIYPGKIGHRHVGQGLPGVMCFNPYRTTDR